MTRQRWALSKCTSPLKIRAVGSKVGDARSTGAEAGERESITLTAKSRNHCNPPLLPYQPPFLPKLQTPCRHFRNSLRIVSNILFILTYSYAARRDVPIMAPGHAHGH